MLFRDSCQVIKGHDIFSCKIALTRTGSALPLVSFWTSPISLFRTFLFPFLMASTCAGRELFFKTMKSASLYWANGPHLIGVRVEHLLADAVQPSGVGNEAQVLLLNELPSRLTWWPPHLLEHLSQPHVRGVSDSRNVNKQESGWQAGGDNCVACAADWPAWQPRRRSGPFPGVPAARPGLEERRGWN